MNLLDILFPPVCLNCGAGVLPPAVVCGACFAAIPRNATLFCGACRARLPRGKRICHYDFPYTLGAAANYDNPAVKNMIHAIKFRGTRRAALPLAELLAQYAENAGFREFAAGGAVIIPVPLGKRRQRTRGYNQAAEIARCFSKLSQLDCPEEILLRTKNTLPQTELDSREKRLLNVNGCFAVKKPEKLRGKRVLLIDDVTTSGATFLAAAETLKAAGGRNILALAVAKA